jgi:catechol 2,3-dioxygenase-like lactoylglutathione lyase family enzyme
VEWSHVGLCVTDLDTSMRFYCEGLGFSPAERYELDSASLPGLPESLEVPEPVSVVSQMITRGPCRIELLAWHQPPPAGTPSARRNHPGLTHLSFWVDGVDAVARRLVAAGGTLLPATRQKPGIDLVFLADPDGTRIELMQRY